MNIRYFLLLLALLPLKGFTQKTEFSFEQTTYDFGTIKEENGPVIHSFKFVNNSLEVVKISEVTASCGCTTPGWTKEAVPPGGDGFVQAKYDPRNRPGPFYKSLTIKIENDNEPIVVFIKGNVEPKPKSIEEQFPAKIGDLGLEMFVLNMGRIKNNVPIEREFEIFNFGDNEIHFNEEIEGPDYIDVKFEPATLPSRMQGTLIVVFDAEKRGDLGFVRDNISIYTNEAENSKKTFDIYTTIDQYFPALDAKERALAPKISFDKTLIDLGRDISGNEIKSQFTITNTGKSDLKILKVKTNCDCLEVSEFNSTMKPDQSGALQFVFKTNELTGTHQKSITVWTNDPARPTHRLLVKVYLSK